MEVNEVPESKNSTFSLTPVTYKIKFTKMIHCKRQWDAVANALHMVSTVAGVMGESSLLQTCIKFMQVLRCDHNGQLYLLSTYIHFQSHSHLFRLICVTFLISRLLVDSKDIMFVVSKLIHAFFPPWPPIFCWSDEDIVFGCFEWSITL
jgi:hypothetical protein